MCRERINRMEKYFSVEGSIYRANTEENFLNCLVTQTPDLLRLSYWLGLFSSLYNMYYFQNFLLLVRCVEEGAGMVCM